MGRDGGRGAGLLFQKPASYENINLKTSGAREAINNHWSLED